MTQTEFKKQQKTKMNWTPYLAAAYAEGFCEGENATAEESIEAWAYLIMTGDAWTLQGFFGRTAMGLIRGGYISKDGTINWNQYVSEKLI